MTNNRIISSDCQRLFHRQVVRIETSLVSFMTLKDVENADVLQSNKGCMTPSSVQRKHIVCPVVFLLLYLLCERKN